ncbi:hypothetical protein NHX12_001970 [Muraenolepis orangiensis]|uniref:Ig-like domain-containing protein n=1 Tax=Muraenolepis orangiensis TaxID=630683 RepID=A0A9Q0E422_9TELE|nr:hypothetical protein NHX12_001970 [Muraenolepis orangiensis]
MNYRLLVATLSLTLSGVCIGEGILPAGPLSGAIRGAVSLSTTLEPTARPFVSVSWTFKGNNFITFTSTGSDFVERLYTDRVTLDRTTGTLELRDLTLGDGGEYLVSITPDRGQQMKGSVQLDVYAYEPLTALPTRNSAHSGPVHHPPLLASPGRVTFSADGRLLSINPVLSDNHGYYRCRLSNPVSAMTAAYNLTVNFGPQNVRMVGPGVAALGLRVLLLCSGDSVPPPTFSWAVNGNKTRLTNATYVIERMEERHAGNYTCTLHNQVTKLEISTLVSLRDGCGRSGAWTQTGVGLWISWFKYGEQTCLEFELLNMNLWDLVDQRAQRTLSPQEIILEQGSSGTPDMDDPGLSCCPEKEPPLF